jgi:hypothetical protein
MIDDIILRHVKLENRTVVSTRYFQFENSNVLFVREILRFLNRGPGIYKTNDAISLSRF